MNDMRWATIPIDEAPTGLDAFVAAPAAPSSRSSIADPAPYRFATAGEAGTEGRLLPGVMRHRMAIRDTAGEHGASNVRLFGSVARGEDTDDSDVDLLVTLEAGRPCSTWPA